MFSFSSLLGSSSSNKKATAQSATSESPIPPLPDSPRPPSSRSGRSPSMPLSFGQPPLVEGKRETPPELLPVFSYLSSHSKKSYADGYLLKLTDLNPDGKPHADRQWMECYAQLVGAVLSLWDAAAIDAAGDVGDVVPTFLNLTDSTIKMIDTLPTKSSDSTALKNVLSISTAGKNRYLFHFDSHHSLIHWTAGIRLALFEIATLQESYTGALIGGKGKEINGINNIMERTRFKYEDWARVRFAAGEPWQRYWTVVSPPDEKAYQKWKKEVKKGKPPRVPLQLGNIKFYPTKKTKKATPIATVTDAFSSYAVYPQSEALIEHSTLVKIEGKIRTHDATEAKEGFVFIMPEAHPGVSGFEMMIRFLFPTFDAFHLYGRPGRLVADIMDIRSLMFAMPRDGRYGYLEVVDVENMISTEARINSEVEWRRKLKELTLNKMQESRKAARNSLPLQPKTLITFDDNPSSTTSSPSAPHPPQHVPMTPPPLAGHQRSISEAQGYMNYQSRSGTGLTQYGQTSTVSSARLNMKPKFGNDEDSDEEDSNIFKSASRPNRRPQLELPADVPLTPTMAHPPSSKPPHPLPPTPGHKSRMSVATLDAMIAAGYPGSRRLSSPSSSVEEAQRNQHSDYSPRDSQESNMFEAIPRARKGGSPSSSSTPSSREMAYGSSEQILHTRGDNHKIMPQLSDSESEYENEEDDYASTDTGSEAVKVPERKEFARPGVMKTVGQGKPRDIVVGDSHYRITTSANPEREASSDIPPVDFGRTINHGRNLSITPVTQASPAQSKAVEGYFSSSGHHRFPSADSPGTSEDRRRDYHSRQASFTETGRALDSRNTPPPDHERQPSQGRVVPWQPGLVQSPGANKVSQRSDTPDKYVAEQAAAAKQQSQVRNRYAHSRKSSANVLRSTTPTQGMSRNTSAEQIPRPLSRGGNAIFNPHGLVSAPDLSSHLSAREQEYIARKTGTTLLQMEGGNVRKQPPHQAGLLGALEAREKEKKEMKESWNSSHVASNNATVQQAIAQRQLHARTASSSSRNAMDTYGRPIGQHQAVDQYIQPNSYNQFQSSQQTTQQQGFYNQASYGQYYGHGGR